MQAKVAEILHFFGVDQDDAFVEKYGLALMESAFESYLPADEVQQGCWRTGKMFGIEHYDIIPEIQSRLVEKGVM